MEKFEIKHTPGPWVAFDRGTGLDEADNLYSIWSIHTSTAGPMIAEIRQEGGSDAAIANPILMAAAPLLLSALIKAVEDIGETYPEPDVFSWYNDALSAIAAAGVTITQVDDTNVADLKTTQQ